jgi:hypothetical protein
MSMQAFNNVTEILLEILLSYYSKQLTVDHNTKPGYTRKLPNISPLGYKLNAPLPNISPSVYKPVGLLLDRYTGTCIIIIRIIIHLVCILVPDWSESTG